MQEKEGGNNQEKLTPKQVRDALILRRQGGILMQARLEDSLSRMHDESQSTEKQSESKVIYVDFKSRLAGSQPAGD